MLVYVVAHAHPYPILISLKYIVILFNGSLIFMNIPPKQMKLKFHFTVRRAIFCCPILRLNALIEYIFSNICMYIIDYVYNNSRLYIEVGHDHMCTLRNLTYSEIFANSAYFVQVIVHKSCCSLQEVIIQATNFCLCLL